MLHSITPRERMLASRIARRSTTGLSRLPAYRSTVPTSSSSIKDIDQQLNLGSVSRSTSFLSSISSPSEWKNRDSPIVSRPIPKPIDISQPSRHFFSSAWPSKSNDNQQQQQQPHGKDVGEEIPIPRIEHTPDLNNSSTCTSTLHPSDSQSLPGENGTISTNGVPLNKNGNKSSDDDDDTPSLHGLVDSFVHGSRPHRQHMYSVYDTSYLVRPQHEWVEHFFIRFELRNGFFKTTQQVSFPESTPPYIVAAIGDALTEAFQDRPAGVDFTQKKLDAPEFVQKGIDWNRYTYAISQKDIWGSIDPLNMQGVILDTLINK